MRSKDKEKQHAIEKIQLSIGDSTSNNDALYEALRIISTATLTIPSNTKNKQEYYKSEILSLMESFVNIDKGLVNYMEGVVEAYEKTKPHKKAPGVERQDWNKRLDSSVYDTNNNIRNALEYFLSKINKKQYQEVKNQYEKDVNLMNNIDSLLKKNPLNRDETEILNTSRATLKNDITFHKYELGRLENLDLNRLSHTMVFSFKEMILSYIRSARKNRQALLKHRYVTHIIFPGTNLDFRYLDLDEKTRRGSYDIALGKDPRKKNNKELATVQSILEKYNNSNDVDNTDGDQTKLEL